MHALVRKTSDLSTRYRRKNKGSTLNQLRNELIGNTSKTPNSDIERGKTVSSTSSQSFEEIGTTSTTNNTSSSEDERIKHRKTNIARRNSSKRSQASSNATIVNSGTKSV